MGWAQPPAPTSVCPSAPPCSPCICGSKPDAGYCLKELAEFPVLLDGGRGSWSQPRAEGTGQPVVPAPRHGYPPLLFSPTPQQGGVGDEGEADGVWELWVCLTWRTRLPGPGRETGVIASIAEQYRRQAGVAGRGKAWSVGTLLLDPSASALLRPSQGSRADTWLHG